MGLLQASQNFYPYPCLDIPITHHHGNQVFLTGTLNIIKTQKEGKIAKIQSPLGVGIFLGGDLMNLSSQGIVYVHCFLHPNTRP